MKEIDIRVMQPWYRHWHSILDEALGGKPDFDLEAAISDPRTNFRMHFCTWDLPDADLYRCFSIFSCGEEFARRAIEMRNMSRDRDFSITEARAEEHMRMGIEGYCRFSQEPTLRNDIEIVRGTEDDVWEQSCSTDNIWELLEYMDYTDPLAIEISQFLTETLYRLASSYEIAKYITWPLYVDEHKIDPQRHFALLHATEKYVPRMGPDGPILFIKTDTP